MNIIDISRSPNFLNRWVALFISFCIVALVVASVAEGQIDGFVEPFRSIELSSDETGAIAVLEVEEGDSVAADQVIARLDIRVQELQLEIAVQMAQTTSQMVAAQETLKKREIISQRLEELKRRGHASQSEIIRAEMELSIAKAKLLSAEEEKTVREIECRKAEVQLARRTIASPFDGVVAKIHRREGEFLSPLHPEVATIIQIDRLLATFAVPNSQLGSFTIGREFELKFEDGRVAKGSVFRIGVETDAQSGTIEVKLEIQNDSGNFRSGEICTLTL